MNWDKFDGRFMFLFQFVYALVCGVLARKMHVRCVYKVYSFYQRGGDDGGGDMDSYQVLQLLLSNHMAWGTANAASQQP